MSNATLTFHLDADFNPYNGNEHSILDASLQGTGPDNVNNTTAPFVINGTNAPSGVHLLCAKLTAANRTRYLYAPEILTVFSSFQPPNLAIARGTNNQVCVDVHGLPGQRAVVQETFDLVNWQPVATNWLTTNLWRLFRTSIPNTQRFYRAALQ
jgi:hypothetical protein